MARVSIQLVPPGFAAVEEVLWRASEKRGSLILSSNVALLAQVRDAAGRSEKLQDAFASGSMQIRPLHEVIRMFADAAEVPLATVAGPEHQAALIGQVCSELSDDSPFAKARSLPGFHKALVTTLQEMRHAQIAPEAAASASRKLEEIARIDEKFQSALTTHRLSTLSIRSERVLNPQVEHSLGTDREGHRDESRETGRS